MEEDKLTGEGFWMLIGVVVIVVLMVLVFTLLVSFGPETTMDLLQGIMSSIALYLVSQIHGILR